MSAGFSIEMSDGVSLAGETLGDASKPALVFSNSLGVTREMWREQADIFAKTYHVVLYDTRGHGLSDAPSGAYSLSRLSLDVLELMDGLKIQQAHFCGLSLGGMTGQALAVRAPERLLSLSLAATSAYMGPPSGWQARIKTVLENGMDSISAAVLERWFMPEGHAGTDRKNNALSWLNCIDPVGYAGCCAAIRDMDLQQTAAIIATPTFILAGENDTATPPEHAQFLHDKIAGSTLVFMPGGHLLNLEQPTLFTDALSEFLNHH